jgi:hypothetical protein
MMSVVVPGAVVWLALAATTAVWLGVLTLSGGRLTSPRRAVRWLLASWLPRGMLLAAWGAAGWHMFCQRP